MHGNLASVFGLKTLPLKSQILLAPAVTIVFIMGLIGFTLAKLTDIQQQNESVREWVRICSHAQGAISATQRMDAIATQMLAQSSDQDDDLHFDYLEQSRALDEHLRYPELIEQLPQNTLDQLNEQQQQVSYSDSIEPIGVRTTLKQLIPDLEKLYRRFWLKKRAAYTDYYDNVNSITAQLITISLSVLAVSVFSAIGLSLWTISRTRKRLRTLTREAKDICSGKLTSPTPPLQVSDEVDELASCFSTMTQRLLGALSTEKVLQGAENERKRIAMDIHDQTLSELTNVTRAIRLLHSDSKTDGSQFDQQLGQIENDLEQIHNSLREVINDLHPQALDLLGFEKALKGYLDSQQNHPNLPNYFVHIDKEFDKTLSEFLRLNLYRICLTVIDNVIQHAHASRMEIEIRKQANQIKVLIEDNGKGFDFEGASKAGGYGLNNVRERAKIIGAQCFWGTSRFSSGTKFSLELKPLALLES